MGNMKIKILILLVSSFLFLVNISISQDNNETIYFDEKAFEDLFGNSSSSETSQSLKNMFKEISSNPPPFDDNTSDVPIDGGLGFLLAAGIGYGANRLRKHKKGINARQK
jgi:hypothetical protein